MSEQQPYEQHLHEQWNDLPLPDENLCWEDMKRRLDKEDNDPVIVWWRKGCGLWVMLLMVAAGVAWWIWPTHQKDGSIVKNSVTARLMDSSVTTDESRSTESIALNKPEGANTSNKVGDANNVVIINKKNEPGSIANDLGSIPAETRRIQDRNRKSRTSVTKSTTRVVIHTKAGKSLSSSTKTIEPVDDLEKRETSGTREPKNISASDSLKEVNKGVPALREDTSVILKKEKTFSNKLTDTTSISKSLERADSASTDAFFFSGGMGLYQQLPIAGQTFTPYNSLGRKGSLADYIPSIYLSYHKKNKWFVQGEFRYGAPQYTRPVEFVRDTKVDSFSQSAFITSLNAKKTFYHQLPVSFNYHINKNWTIGTGIVWNKFQSAVVESQSRFRNLVTQSDSSLSTTIEEIPDSARKNFSTSYFQALIQTQYRWKRLTIGARYTIGIQPYIRYRIDGGPEQKQRTPVVQLFLNFQLWKSRERTRE